MTLEAAEKVVREVLNLSTDSFCLNREHELSAWQVTDVIRKTSITILGDPRGKPTTVGHVLDQLTGEGVYHH
jgi:hypothetical protein